MPTPEEIAAQQAAEQKVAQDTAAAQAAKDKELIEIKVNGQVQKFTLDELKKKASEAAGSQERFQQAAEMTQRAKVALRKEELETKISSAGNVNEVLTEARELAALRGLNPDEFIASLQDEPEPAGGKKPPAEASSGATGEEKQILQWARQRMYNEQIEVLQNNIGRAIDTEAHCVKMIEELAGGDTALANELKNELKTETFKDVQRRVLSQEQTDLNQMVSSSLQEVRANVERQAKRFGTPLKASSGFPVLPLGQPNPVPAEAYAKEPVKRVPVTDKNYQNNFLARLYQRTVRGR